MIEVSKKTCADVVNTTQARRRSDVFILRRRLLSVYFEVIRGWFAIQVRRFSLIFREYERVEERKDTQTKDNFIRTLEVEEGEKGRELLHLARLSERGREADGLGLGELEVVLELDGEVGLASHLDNVGDLLRKKKKME